jgi:hypothetical protein
MNFFLRISESFSWPSKKLTAFGVTRRVIAVFAMSGYRSISWSWRIQSIKSSPIYLPQSYKLFAHLRIGLPHVVFLLGMNSLPHEEHFHVHLIFLHLIILRDIIGTVYKLWSSPSRSFVRCSVIPSLLFHTFFSDTESVFFYYGGT